MPNVWLRPIYFSGKTDLLSKQMLRFVLLLEDNATNTDDILLVSEAHLRLFNSNDYAVFT